MLRNCGCLVHINISHASLHNGAAGGMLYVFDSKGYAANLWVCYIIDSSDRGPLHVFVHHFYRHSICIAKHEEKTASGVARDVRRCGMFESPDSS